ncbi:hypothetical protein [Pleionea litopenaei]|uniref:Uncharacterized protein n=1 Tax=Pleionea litopenaei TaxID=3070815 RepID=A0AA51X6D8_9GAMM|nr:hypothetical protein [Pleionea sp. HL-JVS1]WMS87023.1 hypothetical protein Q9312_17555 [Pleionea sp. HL-JVS1]
MSRNVSVLKQASKWATAAVLSWSMISVSAEQKSNTPDWYLNFDVAGLRSSEIMQHKADDQKKAEQLIDLLLGEASAKSVQRAYAFGYVEEHKVLILQGAFKSHANEIKQRWEALGFAQVEAAPAGIYKVEAKKAIERFASMAKAKGLVDGDSDIQIDDKSSSEGPKFIYSTMLGEQHLVFSDDLTLLQMQQAATLPKMDGSSIFEVVVDVKKALVHGGVNIDDLNQANYQFESISAQQLSQVSVSYQEEGEYSKLQLGLKADTEEVANNIRSIAQGIIALKRLGTRDPVVLDVLNNIRFDQSGGDLLVTLAGPIASLKRLTDDAPKAMTE